MKFLHNCEPPSLFHQQKNPTPYIFTKHFGFNNMTRHSNCISYLNYLNFYTARMSSHNEDTVRDKPFKNPEGVCQRVLTM